MARTVSIGKQNFQTLIENNYFYVDKTNFIKEWWESGDDVTLITRPRRFGKTLNMSMLECFFSYKYAGRSELFEGLSIWNDEHYRGLQGTYPVISLSFADIKESDYKSAVEAIAGTIKKVYGEFEYILDGNRLNEFEKSDFKNVINEIRNEHYGITVKRAFQLLSALLYKYYQVKPIILLDEYDTPLQEAYVNGFWDEIVKFIRGLFNSTFKDNNYMERAILTGITRVSKESIFSDLNNLEVITTTSEQYASCFGFSEKEVFDAMDEMGMTDKPGVKRWYDGFTFGKLNDIYNPWSITKYFNEKKFDSYWANTSSNALIGELLREGSIEIKQDFENLINGGVISKTIDEQVTYKQLDTKTNAIWSLLLATGYLKVLNIEIIKLPRGRLKYLYNMKLTNLEVESMFHDIISDWFDESTAGNYNAFIKALIINDINAMNKYLNRVALSSFSSFDVGKKPSEYTEPERFYHGFVLGLIVELEEIYEIKSNRESGFGRYDIMLRPYDSEENDSIIIEFKVHDPDDEKTLKETVESALKQIEEKNYEAELISAGYPKDKIRKYGFAFKGKTVLIG